MQLISHMIKLLQSSLAYSEYIQACRDLKISSAQLNHISFGCTEFFYGVRFNAEVPSEDVGLAEPLAPSLYMRLETSQACLLQKVICIHP